MKIHLNPKMNSKIADIMRVSEQPAQMYGAALIDAYRASGLEPDEIPHWIPVSDPPKKSGDYLCRYYFGGMAVSYYGTAGEGWNSTGITHWMPLPQPPKEEK